MAVCCNISPCFASEIYEATLLPSYDASCALSELVAERYILVDGKLLQPNAALFSFNKS